MKGHFWSRRGRLFLVVLFATVIVERTDGYPSPWPDFLPLEKQPLDRGPSHNIAVPSSPAEVFRDTAETAAESEAVPYLEPLTTFGDSEDVSRIVEISQQERVVTYGNDETDKKKHEETDGEKDREKDEEEDENYNENRDGNSMENVEANVNRYDNNRTENTDDDIMQVIDDALEDKIFLSPGELELELAKRNGATDGPRKHKTRSPDNRDDTGTQTNSNTNDGNIVFPGQIPITNLDEFARMPVPSCEGTTICEDVPYYPSNEFVESAMRKNYIEPINTPSTISQRMGPLDTDENRDDSLCFYESNTVLPQSGLDENDQWHYILNNEKYVQKVNFERCQNEGNSCKIIETAAGYKTTCKQKYVYQQLVAIIPNGTVALKPIKIPSSCCCHFKFDADVSTRMGISLSKKNYHSPVPARFNN